MATRDFDLASLARGKLVITGIAISTGSKYISAEEKAKTIVDVTSGKPVDPIKERDKMVNGLGINRSSIAGMGEDPITSAALATIKLALGYNIRLDEIKSVTYATESPEDIAKDHAINTIKAVNDLAAVLNKSGYNLGYLDPVDAPHVQSACVAGASNLAEKSRNGIEGKGIIIMSDEARYQEGTVADETGGFGSAVLLVEEAAEAGNKGLAVSSKLIGHARKSVVDFSKPMTRIKDEKSGLALINKHPIVFGKFSELVYIYGTYKSLKKAFESSPGELRDYKKFITSYAIAPHAPYPRMYEKAIVAAVRQFASHDKELAKRLVDETKTEQKFFDGFNDQMEQMGFIIDVMNNSVKLERIIEQNRRLPESIRKKSQAEVNRNLEIIADSIIEKFAEITQKYDLSQKLIGLIGDTVKKLEKGSQDGKCIEDVRGSFDELLGYIEGFMEKDAAYNKLIKETSVFKEAISNLKVVEVSALSKEIGNLYTASFVLSLGSAMMKLQNELKEGKKIIVQAFGSGFEARTVVLDPTNRDTEYISRFLLKNMEYEFSNRKEINAIEAHELRTSLDLKNAGSILIRYEDFVKVDKEKLLKMASEFSTQGKAVPVKTKIRA